MHTIDSIELRVLRKLCRRFKSRSDLAASLLLCSSYGEYRDICTSFEVTKYNDEQLFSIDYLLVNLLKKWVGWGDSDLAATNCYSSWRGAEIKCYHTNNHLYSLFTSHESVTRAFIAKVQRKIVDILGEFPGWEAIYPLCRFSGGASYDISRKDALLINKLDNCSVSQSALYIAVASGIFESVEFVIQNSNRYETVPKTFETDRPICIEPTANMYLQKGLGAYIRKRLKKVGIDLNSQQWNQDLAFLAKSCSLATIDLKSASDTVSIAAVDLLMSTEWYRALDDVRTHSTEINGRVHITEKFSSMGNGFTFELESLLFYAISSTVSDIFGGSVVSVFGDDIIVDAKISHNVINALQMFGFIVNNDKTFTSGSFFESCGSHYFNEVLVTPAYQKKIVGNDLWELIRFHNRLYRWAKRSQTLGYLNEILKYIIEFAFQIHGNAGNCFIPDEFEDDRGFLTKDSSKYKMTKHGDYKCQVLIETMDFVLTDLDPVLPVDYTTHKECDSRLIPYKLKYSISLLNEHPFGYVVRERKTRRRVKTTTVWRSSEYPWGKRPQL